jgi:hypothetical protein
MARKQRGRQKVTLAKVASNAHKSRIRSSIVRGHRSRVNARLRKDRVTPSSTSWTLRRFNSLSEEQRDTYFRAKRVIDDVRSGTSTSQAARTNKTTLVTVSRYFPGDFSKKKGSRRWMVSPSDKHPNQVQWLGKNGYEDFVLRGSRDVSRLGTYLNDVKRALRGDWTALDKWQGRKIGGRVLITDAKTLTALGDEGKLDFEDELLWRSWHSALSADRGIESKDTISEGELMLDFLWFRSASLITRESLSQFSKWGDKRAEST